MLFEANLPQNLKGFVVDTATYTNDILLHASIENSIPQYFKRKNQPD